MNFIGATRLLTNLNGIKTENGKNLKQEDFADDVIHQSPSFRSEIAGDEQSDKKTS